MKTLLDRVWLDEDGNAGIDWIVLTAGIVMLGLTVGIAISTPANDVATDINASLDSLEPAMTAPTP